MELDLAYSCTIQINYNHIGEIKSSLWIFRGRRHGRITVSVYILLRDIFDILDVDITIILDYKPIK